MLYRTLIIAISLPILFSYSSAAAGPWEINEIIGKEAPDFTLKDMADTDVALSSFKGKVIVVNFWATWCKPCKDEMPSLNKLYDTYKDKGLVVLGVSVDKSKKPIVKFLKKVPVDFPILLDANLTVKDELYKVFSLPTTFIIDRSGILEKYYRGEMNWMDPEIIKLIKGYLEQ
jgi:peroxiredoxin